MLIFDAKIANNLETHQRFRYFSHTNNPIPHQSIKIVYKNIAVRAAYMYNKLYIKVIQAAMLCNNRAVTLQILCRPEISAICFWL